MKAHIMKLESKKNEATGAFCSALDAEFPICTKVLFMLSASQKNPSSGTIYSNACSEGRLCIRLDKRNSRGRITIKRVHWSMVEKQADAARKAQADIGIPISETKEGGAL